MSRLDALRRDDEATAAATRAVDPVRHAAELLWPNLPVLLAGSVVVVVACGVVRTLAHPSGLLSVLGFALLVVPALAALLRCAQVLVAGDAFGLVDLGRAFVRSYRPAVTVAAPAAAALALADVAAGQWVVHQRGWMMVSLGLCLAVATVAVAVGIVALPYALRTGCRSADACLVAAYVVTRRPVPVLAVVSAIVLLGWAGQHVSLALMIIFPGPLALLWAVATRSAIDDSRHRLDQHAAST